MILSDYLNYNLPENYLLKQNIIIMHLFVCILSIIIYKLIITIDKNTYVIYNIFHN